MEGAVRGAGSQYEGAFDGRKSGEAGRPEDSLPLGRNFRMGKRKTVKNSRMGPQLRMEKTACNELETWKKIGKRA